MKKLFLSIIIVCLAFTLIGCKNSNNNTNKTYYNVEVNPNNGEAIYTVKVEEGQYTNLEQPTNEGYTFNGWEDNSGKTYETGKILVESDNLSLKAIWEKASVDVYYTITFKVDDQVIDEKRVKEGESFTYPADPTKAGYTFVSWDHTITVAESDLVINAIFEEITPVDVYYTINFYNGTTLLKSQSVKEGQMPTAPTNVTKAADTEYEYQFKGWDKEVVAASADASYYAEFDQTAIVYYTINFYNGTTLISSTKTKAGTMPTVPTNVTKAADETYSYTFKGWDKTVVNATADASYYAQFNQKELNAKLSTLKDAKISILGDSISTFYAEGSPMNSYYSADGTYYYPTYCQSVRTVDKTWWAQLITNTEMVLGINNSWSGSCASGNHTNAGYQDSRVNTLNENGDPDIFIYYLGTNDCAANYSAEQYKAAVELTLEKVKKITDAQIFIMKLGYSNYASKPFYNDTRLAYNEALDEIIEEGGYGVIPLDEYIVEDNYTVYLNDILHYNYKGTTLISKICEKYIKEYNNIEFDEEIVVEHIEPLPEGVLGLVDATATSGFWANNNYEKHIFLFDTTTDASTSPQFSLRIEFDKDVEDNNYYVTAIHKNGESATYSSKFVLCVSSSYSDFGTVEKNLSNVKVGSLVEFDDTLAVPQTITFKVGKDEPITPITPVTPPAGPVTDDGKLHVGKYNGGEWTLYDTTVIAYAYENLDRGSLYTNFCIISLTQVSGNTYKITNLKPAGTSTSFDSCTYYILIYSALTDAKAFYDNAKINDIVTIDGDITAGDANLTF